MPPVEGLHEAGLAVIIVRGGAWKTSRMAKSADRRLASIRNQRPEAYACLIANCGLDGRLFALLRLFDTKTHVSYRGYHALEFFRSILDDGGAPTACAASLRRAFSPAANRPFGAVPRRGPLRLRGLLVYKADLQR